MRLRERCEDAGVFWQPPERDKQAALRGGLNLNIHHQYITVSHNRLEPHWNRDRVRSVRSSSCSSRWQLPDTLSNDVPSTLPNIGSAKRTSPNRRHTKMRTQQNQSPSEWTQRLSGSTPCFIWRLLDAAASQPCIRVDRSRRKMSPAAHFCPAEATNFQQQGSSPPSPEQKRSEKYTSKGGDKA